MNLDVLVKILVDAGVGTDGQVIGSSTVPIFRNRMMATTTRGILIRTPMEGILVDNYLPGFFRTRFQVIVRSTKQSDGDAISRAVMQALKTEQLKVFNDADDNLLMRINYLLVDRMPIIYPRDDSAATEWSLNFKICYCETPI